MEPRRRAKMPPRAGQRYDTHNNLFYDARDRRYLLTTRWEPGAANDTGKRGRRAADGEVTRNRSIAMVRSAPGGEFDELAIESIVDFPRVRRECQAVLGFESRGDLEVALSRYF